MSRTTGGNTTSYTWDVAAGLPVILQDGTNTYVYGLGLISTYDGTNMTYRLTDALGSTMALTDEDGDVVNDYEYDVFGALRDSSGSHPNDFTFAGEQVDGSTGLQYLRARYYDPAAGRFVGRDLKGGTSRHPSTQNAYVYGLSNPCRFEDPLGLSAGETITVCEVTYLAEGVGPGLPPPFGWVVGATGQDELVRMKLRTVFYGDTILYSEVTGRLTMLGWWMESLESFNLGVSGWARGTFATANSAALSENNKLHALLGIVAIDGTFRPVLSEWREGPSVDKIKSRLTDFQCEEV
jgi:RHS repeat-associated protein